MRTLETNDWMILNSIIYKIYTTENLTDMRSQFLEQMKLVLDFDSAEFYLASEEGTCRLSEPVRYNCDEECFSDMEEADYGLGLVYSGKSLVYRETDMVSDEKRMRSVYYQKVYKPNNWHYSLQMILGRKKEFLGVVTFYRTIGKDNFQYDDIFLLDMLKDHLAWRLSGAERQNQVTLGKLTVTQASEQYGLTRREHTILSYLLQGKENGEICQELNISINTLKKHILNIYRKLGIRNRVQMFKMIREQE